MRLFERFSTLPLSAETAHRWVVPTLAILRSDPGSGTISVEPDFRLNVVASEVKSNPLFDLGKEIFYEPV
jgi:hypothetical protein